MHDVPSQLADSPFAVVKPLAHNCLALYHRASAQQRFAMSASMLKCEDFASTFAKGGTDRARSLARIPHNYERRVIIAAHVLTLCNPLCEHARKMPGRFASRLERGQTALQAG